MQLYWVLKKFDALTPHELYAVLQLRNAVFVVEQACIFQDADDKDQASHHLMGFEGNKLVAYTRLLPPGIAYEEASIGRVVTAPAVRRNGAGKELMLQSIKLVYELFGTKDVKIGAQLYLKKFYESFGFIKTGDVYLEDGIEHIHMLKSAQSSLYEIRST